MSSQSSNEPQTFSRWKQLQPWHCGHCVRVFAHTCVEFHMAVSAPLVFKQTAAEGALKRQLVAVDLLVSLQVAQAAKEGQKEMDDEQAIWLFIPEQPTSEKQHSSLITSRKSKEVNTESKLNISGVLWRDESSEGLEGRRTPLFWYHLVADSTIMELQMRTVWTDTALCIGMAAADGISERKGAVEKEHKPVNSLWLTQKSLCRQH